MINIQLRKILWSMVVLLFVSLPATAKENPFPGEQSLWITPETGSVSLYFFWSSRCPHCLEARPYIEALPDRLPWIKIHSHELYEYPENRLKFLQMAVLLNEQPASVPSFMLCGEMFTGWRGEDITGKFLEQKLADCFQRVYGKTSAQLTENNLDAEKTLLAGLPVIGGIDAEKLSLPLLTFVLAGMDAFNPCAFFILLFLLSLMVHLRSRRRMLFIGSVFVMVSGLVYFAFMAAWLNVFMLFGELRWITLAAGSLAIIMALIAIKDYFWLREGVTLSITDEHKHSIFQRGRHLLKADNLPAMFAGTVVLALAANMYELLCTAGFPMVYTRILTLHELSAANYYSYLVMYNVIYVIPLLVIVILFAVTLGSRKLKESEGRFLKLLSGCMMLMLGTLLLLAPEKLSNLVTAFILFAAAIIISFIIVKLDGALRPER